MLYQEDQLPAVATAHAALTTRHHPPPTIPVARGLPLLGEVLHFRHRPFEFFGDLYKQYGPVVEARLAGRRLLVLGGPEANLFFGLNADALSNREQWAPYARELGAVPLNMEDGERHFARRRFLGQYYTPRTLLARLPDVIALTEHRFRHVRTGDKVAIVPTMRALFNDQLGLLLTGATPDGYHDDLTTFVTTSLGVHIGRTLPPIALRFPSYVRAKRRVFELAERALRNGYDTTSDGELSFVGALKAALGDPVLVPDDRALLVSVLGPFVAGIHTAANTTVLALFALSREPEILSRVRAEVDKAFAGGPPSADSLRTLITLRYALMETLRRYPITPLIQRTLTRDLSFEGYDLKKGQLVSIATSASHFLERFYRDPERFDVDRYGPARQEHQAKGAYAPFGIGPHRCLGASLGELQMLVVLATLLHRFDFAPYPDARPRMAFIPGPIPHPKTELEIARVRA